MLQNNKTNNVPLVLFATELWKNMINWQRLIDDELIEKEDMNFIHFSDDVDECVKTLVQRVGSASS
ncbi:hypothetical protein R83H12_02792 [Fibrobacteria bacterium R8-3-H12]